MTPTLKDFYIKSLNVDGMLSKLQFPSDIQR